MHDAPEPYAAEPQTVHRPRALTPEELQVVGLIPLLEPHFRPGEVRELMPEPLRTAMESHGLTTRHGSVLPHLLAGPPLTVGEIAGRLHVSLSTASELVGGLSRAGVARRDHDPANRRRVLVTLADEYRTPLETFAARRGEPLVRALAELTEDERAGFLAGLRAWVAQLQSPAD
ncbi:MarR family winged helix-turn-helix transcriptional regulator [Streptomyces sp. NPDC050504]|uniref:MarR family winged helix-turn-helix transcriptional regulator n=1 Tax=Streptomyces sp. NPDC050504 TaxID=3365618 RepID=UPI0037A3DF2C